MKIKFKYYDYELNKYRIKIIKSLSCSCVISDQYGNNWLSQEKVTRQIKAWFELNHIKARLIWQTTPDFHIPIDKRKD